MVSYLVMKNNFRRLWSNKKFLLFSFILPIAVCLFVGLMNQMGKQVYRVGVVGDLEACENFEGIKAEEADPVHISSNLAMGVYQFVLIADEGEYENQVQKPSQIQLKSNLSETEHKELEYAIENNEFSLAQIKSDAVTKTERGAAFLVMILLILATIFMSKLIHDKEGGLYQRFCMQKSKGSSYHIGYILYVFIMMYMQSLAGCMVLKFLNPEESKIVWIFVLPLFIAAVTTLLSYLLCIISQSEVQASISSSGIAIILALLGGSFVAVEKMPILLQHLSVISPMYWAMQIVLKL